MCTFRFSIPRTLTFCLSGFAKLKNRNHAKRHDDSSNQSISHQLFSPDHQFQTLVPLELRGFCKKELKNATQAKSHTVHL